MRMGMGMGMGMGVGAVMVAVAGARGGALDGVVRVARGGDWIGFGFGRGLGGGR